MAQTHPEVTYRIERNYGTENSPEWEETYWRGDNPRTDKEAIRKLEGLPNRYRITRVTTHITEEQIFPVREEVK